MKLGKSISRGLRASLAVAAVFVSQVNIQAATIEEVMRSRYLKYQFCMERLHGQGFYKKLGLDTVVNKWGVSEPTRSSLSAASDAVQRNEAKCRVESDIAAEPRAQ